MLQSRLCPGSSRSNPGCPKPSAWRNRLGEEPWWGRALLRKRSGNVWLQVSLERLPTVRNLCLASPASRGSTGPVFVPLQPCRAAVLQQSCSAAVVREAETAAASSCGHSSVHPRKPAHAIFDKEPFLVLCHLLNSSPCTSLA